MGGELSRILPPQEDEATQGADGAAPLFLGSIQFTANTQILTEVGVQAVVSCLASRSEEVEKALDEAGVNRAENHRYMHLEDSKDTGQFTRLKSSRNDLNEIIDFIHVRRLAGLAVLVHCDGGVTRSASVLCAYLIQQYTMSFIDARNLIKMSRPKVRMHLFEAELRGMDPNLTVTPALQSLSVTPISHTLGGSAQPSPMASPLELQFSGPSGFASSRELHLNADLQAMLSRNTIGDVSKYFYDSCLEDQRLALAFASMSEACKDGMLMSLLEAAAAPADANMERIVSIHKDMELDEEHFSSIQEHLVGCLRHFLGSSWGTRQAVQWRRNVSRLFSSCTAQLAKENALGAPPSTLATALVTTGLDLSAFMLPTPVHGHSTTPSMSSGAQSPAIRALPHSHSVDSLERQWH